MASALKAECTAPLVTRPAIWKLILSRNLMAFASALHVSGQKLQFENLSPFKLKVKLLLYSYVCGTGERHLLLTNKENLGFLKPGAQI